MLLNGSRLGFQKRRFSVPCSLIRGSVLLSMLSMVSMITTCGQDNPPRRTSSVPSQTKAAQDSSFQDKVSPEDHVQHTSAAIVGTPAGRSNDSPLHPGQVLFQCNAWPVSNTSIWTYWIHWDVVFAAKTAVNACWTRTRLPCTYNCFRIVR